MSPKSTSTKRTRSSNSQSLKTQTTISFKRTKSDNLTPSATHRGGKKRFVQKNNSVSEIDEYSDTERKDADSIEISSDEESSPRKVAPLKPSNVEIDLHAKNPRKWSKHYAQVREMMGGLRPIHADGQTSTDEILRVFDNTEEYGPFVGVTRLRRWQRANRMGLNPPAAVHEILMTKQGQEEDRFRESCLYDMI